MSAREASSLRLFSSKILLFRSSQTIHQVAAIVTRVLLPQAPLMFELFSQSVCTFGQRRISALLGSRVSSRQLALGQKRKRWSAVSAGLWHMAQQVGPFQFLFWRMSLVSSLLRSRSQTKILTFRGILMFQSLVKRLSISPLSCRKQYIDFTVKTPEAVHRHRNSSLTPVSIQDLRKHQNGDNTSLSPIYNDKVQEPFLDLIREVLSCLWSLRYRLYCLEGAASGILVVLFGGAASGILVVLLLKVLILVMLFWISFKNRWRSQVTMKDVFGPAKSKEYVYKHKSS